MKTTTKLGGAVALSLLALAPLAHAQETAPGAEGPRRTKSPAMARAKTAAPLQRRKRNRR